MSFRSGAVILFLSCFWVPAPFLQAQEASGSYHPRELIIRIKDHVAARHEAGSNSLGHQALDAINSRYALEQVRPLVPSRNREGSRSSLVSQKLLLLRFRAEVPILELVKTYQATGQVEYAEPNFEGRGGSTSIAPDDPNYFRQWFLKNLGNFDPKATEGADIDMERAWAISTGSSQVKVAILDSGMRLNHPEISDRIWINPTEGTDSQDNDGNGYVDDNLGGWDFANQDNNPSDDHGHGSNVGGLWVASGNNNDGYAGVDWNCRFIIGKILDERNSGFYSWWTEGIYYAVDNGAQIINMSVGGRSFSSAMKEAVDYAHSNGVLITVSMMNFNNNQPYYPAAYEHTLAVGATDTNDERVEPFFWSSTSGSNYGTHIDLSAPGNFMYGLSFTSSTDYSTYWGGTSQAAPLVAGVASLIKAIQPGFGPDTIRSILRLTAEDQVGDPAEDTPGWDQYHGTGRLNAFHALLYARGSVEPVSLCVGSSFEGRFEEGLHLDTLIGGGTGGQDSFRLLAITHLPAITLQDSNVTWDPNTATGNIEPEIRGGTGKLSYAWSSGETSKDIFGKTSGTYTLTISDEQGCSSSFTFDLGVFTSIPGYPKDIQSIRLEPNPVIGTRSAFLAITTNSFLPLRIRLRTGDGKLVREKLISVQGKDQIPLDTGTLPSGLFLVEILTTAGDRVSLTGLKIRE